MNNIKIPPLRKINKIIKIIIKYRWQQNSSRVNWKKITNFIKINENFACDKILLQELYKTKHYHVELIHFISKLPKSEIKQRNQKAKSTIPEYLAGVFGIPVQNMRVYCENLNLPSIISYVKDDGGRENSHIRKMPGVTIGQNDCGIRALTYATNQSYDDVFTEIINKQHENPTTYGCYPKVINNILKKYNWHNIKHKPYKKQTIYTLFNTFPSLKNINIVFTTANHIFYVCNGTIKDLNDFSSSKITKIYVKNENYNSVNDALYTITLDSLANTIIENKRQYKHIKWKEIAEKLNIHDYDVENIRHTKAFSDKLLPNEKIWKL